MAGPTAILRYGICNICGICGICGICSTSWSLSRLCVCADPRYPPQCRWHSADRTCDIGYLRTHIQQIRFARYYSQARCMIVDIADPHVIGVDSCTNRRRTKRARLDSSRVGLAPAKSQGWQNPALADSREPWETAPIQLVARQSPGLDPDAGNQAQNVKAPKRQEAEAPKRPGLILLGLGCPEVDARDDLGAALLARLPMDAAGEVVGDEGVDDLRTESGTRRFRHPVLFLSFNA